MIKIQQDNIRWRITLSVALIALLIVEAVPELRRAIYGSFDASYVLSARLIDTAAMILTLVALPLFAIINTAIKYPALRNGSRVA
jgi:hypothetical protein